MIFFLSYFFGVQSFRIDINILPNPQPRRVFVILPQFHCRIT